ncbi:hypothetical protein GUJ93_ZPchr0012g20787 [Zizania palustris]|uniref:Uncharacterized protein n=2 Tax=Zizania palustris TaxID=103762 RepID=A0A8J6BT04_ZIZPA|nr:hypothetical protein GUJ93_ZPchr0012g20787 [Zizania palustris]KAG8094545.1 hypothetical protein GUJ93_ZPchr0012g20787 [Zizania palustris]
MVFFKEMESSSASYISYLRQIAAASVSAASCDVGGGGGGSSDDECRNEGAAFRLKMVAIMAILVSGAAGVVIPLVGQKRRGGGGGASSGGTFVLAKAFAAGVILATGFVHMLHGAEHALSNPCLPVTPWRRFPFTGFIAMLAALGTLVVDFVSTHFYERKHSEEAAVAAAIAPEEAPLLEDGALWGTMSTRVEDGEGRDGGRERQDAMHIVGMHAHAAAHRHSHAHGHSACDGGSVHAADAHGHGHEEGPSARHVIVSQILELGIVSHSVIIGLSLGVSESPCTIKPLVAALSFHQFFEGFALGGCISEAQLKNFSAFMMAFFFAITTPAGISVGTAIASFYNPNSPRALVVEGILDSMSAGILIYMALVDLIAADFLSRKMSCNPRLQVGSYIALFLGAMAMAALAIWA